MVIRCLPVVSAAARHNLPRYVHHAAKQKLTRRGAGWRASSASCMTGSRRCHLQEPQRRRQGQHRSITPLTGGKRHELDMPCLSHTVGDAG